MARRPRPEVQANEAPEFKDAGYDDTLPGQTEVVAGTPQHEQLLKSYSNVSSYGPDHNVVLPSEAPMNTSVPAVTQNGSMLNCTMGTWTGEPTSYEYQWVLDDVNAGTGADYDASADVGKTAVCVVSATNEFGTTAAPPSNAIVVA